MRGEFATDRVVLAQEVERLRRIGVVKAGAQAGIVISASHNPYYDNGIKFFSSQGAKLPDEVEYAIEAELAKG